MSQLVEKTKRERERAEVWMDEEYSKTLSREYDMPDESKGRV